MPEGPFGFERLTSLGPFVKKDESGFLKGLKFRGHSYRNYSPEEFQKALKSGFDQRELAGVLRRMESGRFHDMLKSTHTMWIALDNDEKRDFYHRNPNLMVWVEVWAQLEDQRRPSEDVEL